MKNFLTALMIWVGLCIAFFIIYTAYPKYYFVNEHTRCNKITGKVERYYSNTGWQEKL